MENVTVSKILCEVIDTICDKHCKFPEIYEKKYADEYEAAEKLSAEKCDKCVLCNLM